MDYNELALSQYRLSTRPYTVRVRQLGLHPRGVTDRWATGHDPIEDMKN